MLKKNDLVREVVPKWWYVWKQKVRNSVGFCWLVLCHFALFGQTCLLDLVGTFFAPVCSHIVMANAPVTLPTIFGSFSHYFSIWMNASTFYLKDKSTKGHRGWWRLDHTPKPLMDRNHASSLLVIGRRKNYQGSVKFSYFSMDYDRWLRGGEIKFSKSRTRDATNQNWQL